MRNLILNKDTLLFMLNKNQVILFDLDNHNDLANNICKLAKFTLGEINIHQFPDEEILIRLLTDVKNHDVIFLSSTNQPNTKMALLAFAAGTARELGANKVGLITPYLAYMRQDKQFHAGEGITSKYYARFLSQQFDWLITIDPHLHRWHSLNEIYTIPTTVLHAIARIAKWIKQNITKPVLVGPDSESQQWVGEVANLIQAPYVTVEKTRFGDQHVKATIPQIEQYRECTPVVVDDIISSAMTMIETVMHLQELNFKQIQCVGVHAVFADDAYQKLLATGAKVATCNTIPHISNQIDVSDLIVKGLL